MELSLEGVRVAVEQAHRATGVDAVRMNKRTWRALRRAWWLDELENRFLLDDLRLYGGACPPAVIGTRVLIDDALPDGKIAPLFEPVGVPGAFVHQLAQLPPAWSDHVNTSPTVDRWDRSWADYELGPSPARPTVDSHVVQASKMAEEELSAWADFTQEMKARAARRRGPG